MCSLDVVYSSSILCWLRVVEMLNFCWVIVQCVREFIICNHANDARLQIFDFHVFTRHCRLLWVIGLVDFVLFEITYFSVALKL
jgi:hypothetical protein